MEDFFFLRLLDGRKILESRNEEHESKSPLCIPRDFPVRFPLGFLTEIDVNLNFELGMWSEEKNLSRTYIVL